MNKKQTIEQGQILTKAHLEFGKGLSKYAMFKINNQVMSEDMVQTTFLKTWTYLVKGGKVDLMKAFLYHILNNLIIDEYRKRKVGSLDDLMEKGFEPGTDESERVVNILDGKRALLLIKLLPKKYIRTMNMRHVELLSIEEISKAVGQSKNTVTVQLHRGLEKLKVLYKKQ
jgi:RNA polymerase sigma factor (sigma-70 family)